MTDMQRYLVSRSGLRAARNGAMVTDEIVMVTAADAEAAIAAAEWRVRSECIQDGVPYTWNQGEVDLFRWQGQRDMLAKCIEAVQQALDKFWEESDADELGWREQHELYVDALRALEEKP